MSRLIEKEVDGFFLSRTEKEVFYDGFMDMKNRYEQDYKSLDKKNSEKADSLFRLMNPLFVCDLVFAIFEHIF